MQSHFYGHACLKITGKTGAACLMDPWFAREGAFFSAWFQFPENHHLADIALTDSRDICVSHNHEDHFDPRLLDRALGTGGNHLHIARFQTDWFSRRCHQLLPKHGERIQEHDPFQPFEVASGGQVYFVPEESPGQIDSAMVHTSQDGTLVNLNDARLTTDQLMEIKRLAGRVDVLALQASGASEYPVNYLFEPDDMLARCREKRRVKFEHAWNIIGLLDPDRVLFFAGPPCFLDPELSHHGARSEDSVFPDQLDIVKHMSDEHPELAGKIWFALPGEQLGDDLLWDKTDQADSRLHPYTKKEDYLESYRLRRKGLETFDAGQALEESDLMAHFQHMATVSPYLSGRISGEISFVIRDQAGEQAFTVDFGNGTARTGTSDEALYVLTAPASSVAAVISGNKTWDDIFLSLRMTFDERTERFVPHFKALLKYMDPAMAPLLETYEEALGQDTETMEIRIGDAVHHVQRRCPHAGADLSRYGRIDEEEGTLTCMAHRFCFDLATGGCLNAEGFKLRINDPT